MTLKIILAVILGILAGHFIIPPSALEYSDLFITIALNILLFLIGIDLGRNKHVFKDVTRHGMALILVPLGIIAGSMIGGIAAGYLTGTPLNLSLSVSSGFGWYSLSGILLTDLHGAEIGAVAFLTNILRELLAICLIPYLALKLNHWSSIAPAGATSMDTTLPIISKATSPEVVVVAFFNGAVLSALVPVLVPFWYNILK